MKEHIDLLRRSGLRFKSTAAIDPKIIGIKKKLTILKCVDDRTYYHCIFFISGKSRFLQKNSLEAEAIYQKTVQFCDHNFKYKHIYIQNDCCSKARLRLEENGWKVHNG